MHSCPVCGQACYCSGDIEDHDTGPEYEVICTCCEGRDDNEEPEFEPELELHEEKTQEKP